MATFIIGLDGATYKIIDGLVARGVLPFMRELLQNGVRGVLESTMPPLTGPAWVALATGKNPGKTGIFDFFKRARIDSFITVPVSSRDFKESVSFWDILSAEGFRVGVCNYPLLYPPYEINGIMVSGLGAGPEDDITYPGYVKAELNRECGGYRIDVPWGQARYRADPWRFIGDIMKLIEVNERTLRYMLRQNFDVLIFVISVTDFIQHYMWRFIDPTHPNYRHEEARQFGPCFVEIWKRIDGIVGVVLDEVVRCGGNLLVVSDHGFAPYRSVFYANRWLELNGYLARKSLLVELAAKMQNWAVRAAGLLPDRFQNRVLAAGCRHGLTFAGRLDLERTRAFVPANSSMVGNIYVSSRDERESLIAELMAGLSGCTAELGLKTRFYFRTDLFTGRYTELAPDFFFDIDDFQCAVRYEFADRVYRPSPHLLSHSGLHDREGIFIFYGRDMAGGRDVGRISIYDVAPTVLHLCGVRVPGDVDGRVVTEIFRNYGCSAPASGGGECLTREKVRLQVKRFKEKITLL